MSAAAHTPGPWECDTAGQPIIINGPDDSGNIVAVVYDKKCAPAHTDPEHQYGEEVAAANARVLTEAPAMLEALEDMLSACAAFAPEGVTWEPRDRARAIVARARGRA